MDACRTDVETTLAALQALLWFEGVSNRRRLIFLHGLESRGQGYKGRLLRRLFSDMLTPDFSGPFDQRMAQLAPILGDELGWTMVGSSFGGLMAASWACTRPWQVVRLILLAPALHHPEFAASLPAPVDLAVTIYHGRHDTVVPLDHVRAVAGRVFTNLTFHVVDDDHFLRATVDSIDWTRLLRP